MFKWSYSLISWRAVAVLSGCHSHPPSHPSYLSKSSFCAASAASSTAKHKEDIGLQADIESSATIAFPSQRFETIGPMKKVDTHILSVLYHRIYLLRNIVLSQLAPIGCGAVTFANIFDNVERYSVTDLCIIYFLNLQKIRYIMMHWKLNKIIGA